MPPPVVTVWRRAAYDRDDEALLSEYHERQARQKPPPPYRYPLRHWMLWLAFSEVLAGFCISSVGALSARFEAVKAERNPYLGSDGDLEGKTFHDWTSGGGSKGLRMRYLPAHLLDDMADVHLAANALSMGTSIVVMLQAVARRGCVGFNIAWYMHLSIISLVAAAVGLNVASQAYAAKQLLDSSTFKLRLARNIYATEAVRYSHGRFALESWACQLKDLGAFDDGTLDLVCTTAQNWRSWGIASAVFGVVVLFVLVVDWRFRFFVKRQDKTG